jgi:hypothetical protein
MTFVREYTEVDHLLEIEEICETALTYALLRPLTQAEITALRWAANLPQRKQKDHNRPEEAFQVNLQNYVQDLQVNLHQRKQNAHNRPDEALQVSKERGFSYSQENDL